MTLRRMWRTVVWASALVSGVLWAQKAPVPHIKVPLVAARAQDVSSPEAIVLADYACISGGVGVPRQWARDLSLYNPHAYFVATGKDRKTGAVVARTITQPQYTDATDARLVADGVTERELAHRVYRFGNVATVFSSYESKSARTGQSSRGVNLYQVYFNGKRWWIASVVWDEERADNPIPADLRPLN